MFFSFLNATFVMSLGFHLIILAYISNTNSSEIYGTNIS